MSDDPRVRSDSSNGASIRDSEGANHATQFFSDSSGVTQVAQTLVAHGGGAVAVDLALDLVLNEIVEQARNATGATGAAVALLRDGELTCRATTGENAPDLGVRVDATSGLAGSCFSTGEIQQCRDTEDDARVNAEACRRLGVRSMLIAPLVDHNRTVGIIQVFSAWPNAFGKREICALQVLAGRIAENTREAEAVLPVKAGVPELPVTYPVGEEAKSAPIEEPQELAMAHVSQEKPSVIWGIVLIVLVIATAITLGIVIGWRRAARVTTPVQVVKTTGTAPATADAAADTGKGESSGISETPAVTSTKAGPSFPAGGLLVTENGKVVYRSTASAQKSAVKNDRSLIHRVEPVYPADAKAQHIQGSVVLEVQVLGTGNVGNVAVVSGHPLLTEAAVEAVKQWRYQPSVINGQDVESQTRVTVKFSLPPS